MLAFAGELVYVWRTPEELTTTTKTGLKNGVFDIVLVVGRNGVAVNVNGARKLRGVGPFRGYNVFLNQRIRVELEIDGDPFAMTLDKVKARVRESFRRWHGWEARGDLPDLEQRLGQARSVDDVIRLLDQAIQS